MKKITENQYQIALERIEELLPQVAEDTPVYDKKAVELALMSDIVIEYETEHFPIEKPTVSELISSSLKEQNITQKELAQRIGVSPSRINDYISGRSEPSLRIARALCITLGISPFAMLGM